MSELVIKSLSALHLTVHGQASDATVASSSIILAPQTELREGNPRGSFRHWLQSDPTRTSRNGRATLFLLQAHLSTRISHLRRNLLPQKDHILHILRRTYLTTLNK
jgi:hypothetical protein